MFDETLNLALKYLMVRWRTKDYIVLGIKCLLLVDFSEIYFVSIDRKTLLTIQNKWRKEHVYHGRMDLQINIHGKCH